MVTKFCPIVYHFTERLQTQEFNSNIDGICIPHSLDMQKKPSPTFTHGLGNVDAPYKMCFFIQVVSLYFTLTVAGVLEILLCIFKFLDQLPYEDAKGV